jgi:predicted RNA binding protein YcfA (HicA-like mRNA interferase family)
MAKRPKPVRNYRDVEKALRRGGISWTKCKGSHRKARLPNNTTLVYHSHGEYGKGIACKITKVLTAAGLLAAIVSIVFYCM